MINKIKNTDMKNETVEKETFKVIGFTNSYKLVNPEDDKFKVKLTPSQRSKIREKLRNSVISNKGIELEIIIEDYRSFVSVEIKKTEPKTIDYVTKNWFINLMIGKRGKITGEYTNKIIIE